MSDETAEAITRRVLTLLDDTEWWGLDAASGGFEQWGGRKTVEQRLRRAVRHELRKAGA